MAYTRILGASAMIAGITALFLAGIMNSSKVADAQQGTSEESRVRRGFEIAPVPLNLEGKKPGLGGIG